MAGQRADDRGVVRDAWQRTPGAGCLAAAFHQPRYRCGAGRLHKHALVRRQPALGSKNFRVGNDLDGSTRFLECPFGLLPARWVSDPDGGRSGLRVFDNAIIIDWRSARGLESEHSRKARRALEAVVFDIPLPVCGRVAGVAADAEQQDRPQCLAATRGVGRSCGQAE